MSYDFYGFLDRMKYIKRWALMRSVREENIMEHSQEVALISHALAVINNRYLGGNADGGKCALYAVYHECSEVITGDLPTPVKYFNKSITGAYKDLEGLACDKLLGMLPEEMREDVGLYVKPDTSCYEWKIVKAADRLSAYIKCLEERRCGNTEFESARKSIEEDLKSRNMPEVKLFFDMFIGGYEKTLDELDTPLG